MTQHVPPLAGLTPDQQAGADAFFSFLMSPAKTFVLSGGAGVGKTFLMSHLVRQTMKEYATACALLGIKEEFDSLVFTATTNKAAEVLEQSLGLPVQTIHSYLNLKVTENLKTGKTDVEKTGAWKIRRRLIVFIDECSMEDRKLYDIIMESLQDSKNGEGEDQPGLCRCRPVQLHLPQPAGQERRLTRSDRALRPAARDSGDRDLPSHGCRAGNHRLPR